MVLIFQILENTTEFSDFSEEIPKTKNTSSTFSTLLQENTHRLTLSMSPDENYLEKQAKEEEEKLQKKIHVLSDADRTELYEKGNDMNYCDRTLQHNIHAWCYTRVFVLPVQV